MGGGAHQPTRGSVRIHLRRRCLARIQFESFSRLNGLNFSPNDNVRLKAGPSFAKTLKKVLQIDDNIRKRLYCDRPFCVPGFLVLFSLV